MNKLNTLVGIDVLLEPITWEEIEWRIASRPKKEVPEEKKKTQILAYINNRCVMDRFDQAFNWDGWENEIKEIQNGFLCTIKVLTEVDGKETWVSKTDGASKTAFEPEKGGISDSMKRCAVQFGLGRGLYSYPKTYIKGDHAWVPKWAVSQLRAMVNHINDPERVSVIPEVVVIEQKEKIMRGPREPLNLEK